MIDFVFGFVVFVWRTILRFVGLLCYPHVEHNTKITALCVSLSDLMNFSNNLITDCVYVFTMASSYYVSFHFLICLLPF